MLRMQENSLGPLQARPGDAVTGTAPRLYERAAELLSEQIRNGTIAAGTFVTELAVAERFGISRAPARRALGELERKGLVERTKGRGYAILPEAAQLPGAPLRAPHKGDNFRLHPGPSWERIYGEVENEIIARISFADWRINEAKLARHYKVSRTVARDVIGRLQQRGVLRKDGRSRWVAPALTPAHIGELYELRAILEPVALAKAAPNAPADLFRTMRNHLEEAIESSECEGSTLDRLEEELHVTFLGLCGNRTLIEAIALPQSLLVAHRFLYRWTLRLFDKEPFLPEHLEVVHLLERGNIDRAANSLAQHLLVSRERAIARVDVIRSEFRAENLSYLERLSPDS
jgi:DNA-binding GntR family transcriptional regulator